MIHLVLCLSASGFAYAENPVVPPLINYQGMLTDADGAALSPDGQYTLEFRLWSDSTTKDNQHLVWGRAFPVIVIGGYFNVILSDDGHGLADADQHRVRSLLDAFASPERYLGITITNAPADAKTIPDEIAPRQQILSAPYAMQSQEAYHAVKADHALEADHAVEADHALAADRASVMTVVPQLKKQAGNSLDPIPTSETLLGSITINRTRLNPHDPSTPLRPVFVGLTGLVNKRHGSYAYAYAQLLIKRNNQLIRYGNISTGNTHPNLDEWLADIYTIDTEQETESVTYTFHARSTHTWTKLHNVTLYAYELYLHP